jgi:putative MATE family efflux protein
MNTPEDIYDMAYEYIIVICGGLTAIVLYNLFSCMLRSIGDSRDPLIFLVLSTVMNIVLDLVFVMVLHAGVAGAAWATVLSQAAAAAAEFVFILCRVPELHFAPRDMIPDGKFVRDELRIGVPMGFQFSITAIGSIILQSSLNMFGSTYIAAYTAGNKIQQLTEQLFTGLGATMSSYCAQNTGAGRYDRIKKGIHAADIQGGITAVAAGILCMTVGDRMTVLFVSDRVEEIMPLTSLYLKCSGLFMIPLAAIFIYRNSLQGMGYSFVPLFAGVVELFARTLAGIIAADRMSYFGICMANPAAWLSAATYLIISYVVLERRRKRKAACAAADA